MTLGESLKTQFDAHRATQVQKPENQWEPFEIEVKWINGAPDVIRVYEMPDAHAFVGSFRGLTEQAGHARFTKNEYVISTDHIRQFRKMP